MWLYDPVVSSAQNLNDMEGMNKFKSLIKMLNGGAQKGNREVHKLLINIVTLTIIGREECHQLHHGLLLFPGSYCTRQLKYDALNRVCTGGARVAQWWEHSPPTNVARVQIPALTPYVGWVRWWFSPLLREVFLQVLRFSPVSSTTNTSKLQFETERMDTFQRVLKNSLVLRLVGKQIIKKIYNFHDS